MRVIIGFFFSLVWALAESTYQTPLAAYLGLTGAQSDALERGYGDFNDFAAARQARLDQLSIAISYARAAAYPDLADIGRLYLEYEVILRDAVAHADAWHSTAVAILTAPQVAKLENIRRSYDLYDQINWAQTANLIGPVDGGLIATPPLFDQYNVYPTLNPYAAYQLQAYLGLSDTQIRTLVDILYPELIKASDIYSQIVDSEGKVGLELTKDAPDPITIGQLITGMDAAAAQPTAGRAQIREALLAQLTPAQRKLVAQLDEFLKGVNLVQPATCLALVAPQLNQTTVTASGAIAFNVNQVPRLDFGCGSY